MGGIASKGQLRASLIRWILVCIPLVLLLGFLSAGSVSVGEDSRWYRALAKPALTPPAWVFPIAWSTLYVLMGLALAMVLNARRAEGRGVAITLFVTQLVFNLAWTPVFFGAHQVQAALLIIAAMIGLTIGTIGAFRRVRRLAAWLMLPYLVWIVFAAALNWRVLQLNPDADTVAPTTVSTQIIG